MKKNIIIKEILLVLTTIIWGFGFIAQLKGGDYLDTFTFNFFRNLIATITLFTIVLIFDFWKKKKNSFKENIDYSWKNKQLWIGGILTGFSISFAMTAQQNGIMLEGAGKAGFLTALYIVFVPVINLFFGKRINIYISLAILFSLLGLYLINSTTGEFHFSFGTVLLLLCALGYSGQILSIDKFSKGIDTIKFSFVQFASATIFTFIIALIFGTFDKDMIIKAIPAILYLGILSSGVAYTLQIYSQSEVNVTVACIIMSLESVFALLFGMMFANEKYGILELLGCLSILVAVMLAQLQPRKMIMKDLRKQWEKRND